MRYKAVIKDDRLCLPKMEFDIRENDILDITVKNDTIIITKIVPGCFICDSTVNLIRIQGKHICTDCIGKIKYAEVGEVFY